MLNLEFVDKFIGIIVSIVEFILNYAIPIVIIGLLIFALIKIWKFTKKLRKKKVEKHRRKNEFYDYRLQNKFNGGKQNVK